MIAKELRQVDGRAVARVLFCRPDVIWCDQVHLVGDFNGWNQRSHPLRPSRQGCPELTLELEAGRADQFRYPIDGAGWMNDPQADADVQNPTGSDNVVVVTDPEFTPQRNHKGD